jgi:hypothetical protein
MNTSNLFIVNFYFFFIFFISCNNINSNLIQNIEVNNTIENYPEKIIKPGSSFTDTLKIKESAVIFFNPDSLQIIEIKKQYKPSVYQSLSHEYYYQQKTAKVDLINNLPNVKLYEVVNSRYLLFIHTNKKESIIDLNNIGTFSGCFIFNGVKEPVQVDMMSFMNEAYYYFK